MARQGRTRPLTLAAAERRAHVFQLRRTGATYAVIYATMRQDAAWRDRLPKSYNARHVHTDVMVELQRLRTELAEDAEAVRTQELDRLDRMLLGLWPRAQAGDTLAVHTVLELMARRARLVPGLETPLTLDATVEAGQGLAALLAQAQEPAGGA